jgi:hypothetical protein
MLVGSSKQHSLAESIHYTILYYTIALWRSHLLLLISMEMICCAPVQHIN